MNYEKMCLSDLMRNENLLINNWLQYIPSIFQSNSTGANKMKFEPERKHQNLKKAQFVNQLVFIKKIPLDFFSYPEKIKKPFFRQIIFNHFEQFFHFHQTILFLFYSKMTKKNDDHN
jgi:hypothetical protein